MLRYIKGTLEVVSESFIIVESAGMGYQINVASSIFDKLPDVGEAIKIYTYLSVKDDSFTLFGFFSMEEYKTFNRLITVSGVGPKAALNILSSLSPEQIALAIISDDSGILCKAVGIGRKTAQRIILELKDKVKETLDVNSSMQLPDIAAKQDAIEALIALGYDKNESVSCVMNCYSENMSSSDLIKASLRKLATM